MLKRKGLADTILQYVYTGLKQIDHTHEKHISRTMLSYQKSHNIVIKQLSKK